MQVKLRCNFTIQKVSFPVAERQDPGFPFMRFERGNGSTHTGVNSSKSSSALISGSGSSGISMG